MSYVQSTLAPDEKIRAVARFHWSYTAAALLWILAGALATLWLWANYVSGKPSGIGWAVITPLVIGIFMGVKMLINRATTEIAVTNLRIVCKQGFIARRTSELPLTRVEEINVQQSMLGRILGYGRVLISGTGGDKPMNIPTIDNPVAFRTAIPMKGHAKD